MWSQFTLDVATHGRGTYDITDQVNERLRQTEIDFGLVHLFIRHTSASLIICENADPAVRSDLERFMSRLVPDGDALYQHTQEGPDDMPAHVRSILTECGLSIPLTQSRLSLGTWQGVYLWEHRHAPHRRQITVTVQGQQNL